MQHTVVRLRGVRMVVVLVERWQMNAPHSDNLIFELQQRFSIPAMLVTRDDSTWTAVRAHAQFDALSYVGELLAVEDIEWSNLPEMVEPEPPF